MKSVSINHDRPLKQFIAKVRHLQCRSIVDVFDILVTIMKEAHKTDVSGLTKRHYVLEAISTIIDDQVTDPADRDRLLDIVHTVFPLAIDLIVKVDRKQIKIRTMKIFSCLK